MSSRISPRGLDLDPEQFAVQHGHRPRVRSMTGGLIDPGDQPKTAPKGRVFHLRPTRQEIGDVPLEVPAACWEQIVALAKAEGVGWNGVATPREAHCFGAALERALQRELTPELRQTVVRVVRLCYQNRGLAAQVVRRDW